MSESNGQIADLRARIEELERQRRFLLLLPLRGLGLIYFGPRLIAAFRAAWIGWIDWSKGETWPEVASREFAEALLARWLRILTTATLIAVVPTVLLLAQTVLLSRQNDRLDRQNSLLSEQTVLLKEQTRAVEDQRLVQRREAELLAFEQLFSLRERLYRPSFEEDGVTRWPPPNPSIVQQVALLARIEPTARQALKNLLFDDAGSVSSTALLALIASSTGTMSLRGARLAGTDLSNANLVGQDLSESDLSFARLRNADLASANLTDASLVGAVLESIRAADVQLARADLTGSTVNDSDFARANLADAELSDCTWVATSAPGSQWHGVVAVGAQLEVTGPVFTSSAVVVAKAAMFDRFLQQRFAKEELINEEPSPDAETDDEAILDWSLSSEPSYDLIASIQIDPVTLEFVYPVIARRQIMRVAQWLQFNEGSKIHLVGHTDQRGSEESKLMRGDQYARIVRKLLHSLVPATVKLTQTRSEGGTKPVLTADGPRAWKTNNRVAILGEL